MNKIMIINHGSVIGGAGLTISSAANVLSVKYDVVTYTHDRSMDIANMIRDAGGVSKTFSTALGTIPWFSGGPGIFSIRFYKGMLFALLFAGRWERIIKAEKPDVLIVSSKVLCWYALIAKRLGVKCICYVQETAPNRGKGFWNSIVRGLLEKCDGVFFISDYDEKIEDLKKPYTVTIPNFISIDDYVSKLSREEACDRLGLHSDVFNILYVGGISKSKGFDILIDSLQYLKSENVNLIIAGQGFETVKQQGDILKKLRYIISERRYVEEMMRLLEDKSIADKVHFVGLRKDMENLYAASDVLVFPARDAHQSRPAFEIGVQKKPVIISDFEMTREFVKDGVNGLAFKPCDPESLAGAVKLLINDKELYRTLGENNYAQTVKYHVVENAEQLLCRGIETVLQS